ncbi:MAG: molybdopterin-dependent oxidoreductase [Acidimicrobiia bacterium]|nr:molybdopterin-dependent oxidoreductase [Acidimicrobiia bacterium]
MTTTTDTQVRGGIGESVKRPDGIPKVTGNFAYASDLTAEGMLWGATLRSPFAHARLVRIDTAASLAIPGVHAVLTQDDVPGRKTFGQIVADQPVLVDGEARFWGEPVAVVAADDPETARIAVATIEVEWEELDPLVDMETALEQDEVFRYAPVRRGDQQASGSVVVEEYYEVGTQDQAPLGTEAGLAIPDGEGGIDLWVTSQWTHEDHDQIWRSLDLAPDQIRQHPTGIGGAFGAREDMSLHLHLCLLALRTGRPVKMVYNREESFPGHVHRHPARLWYRHEAESDGKLVRVEAKMILDGGAYTDTTPAVVANAVYFAVGPYNVDSVTVDGYGVRTNNPPTGAMRGFGVVQACYAAESQMDRLAAELGMDPLELRKRNAMTTGDAMPTTGQIIETSLPTVEVIDEVAAIPLPPPLDSDDPLHLPGGTGLTTTPQYVTRGIGYAVSIKNIAFSEAFDDFAEARVVLTPSGVEVHTAAVEVGQGMVTVLQQIARTALGIEQVAVVPADTSVIGSAGSTSASRQTQMTGGAVLEASRALRAVALERGGGDELNSEGVWRDGALAMSLEELCADGPLSEHTRFRHPPTVEPDENGQGDLHADFAVAAHRAVVDVDTELGLVRVVQVDTAQDVGMVLNPQSARGQIEGGILQGVGLAVMEELIVDQGIIRNASFTDYLLPTFLDAPDVEMVLLEEPSPWGPFGAKGIGEPPTISSTPAVAAAIRNATGLALNRVPIRPQDITGT